MSNILTRDPSVAPSIAPAIKPTVSRVCAVCSANESKYACPRCNRSTCTLTCYKAHSNQCVETFMTNQSISSMQSVKADDQMKRHMNEILQRVHELSNELSDEESDETANETVNQTNNTSSDKPDDSDYSRLIDMLAQSNPSIDKQSISELSEDQLIELVDRCNLSIDDLSINQSSDFNQAIKDGRLAKYIAPYKPWWVVESSIDCLADGENWKPQSIKRSNNKPIKPIVVVEDSNEQANKQSINHPISQSPDQTTNQSSNQTINTEWQSWFDSLPALETLLPPSVKRSKFLPILIIQSIYAFCLIDRLYCGDWLVDCLIAYDEVISIAPSIVDPSTDRLIDENDVRSLLIESMTNASHDPINQSINQSIDGLRDTAQICLNIQFVSRALFELHRLFEATDQPIKQSNKRSNKQKSKPHTTLSTDQSINQSNNQTINQSDKQSIKQSVKQSNQQSNKQSRMARKIYFYACAVKSEYQLFDRLFDRFGRDIDTFYQEEIARLRLNDLSINQSINQTINLSQPLRL